jgi:hypothetical protein
MKSAERHRLETNWMAKHLELWIDKLRPYFSMLAGAVVALVVVMFAWSYLTGSSTARQSEAWDAYNLAVEQPMMPDIELLRQSAEEYPGTKMQELADITWADGQVWMAARDFIYQRPAAMEALNRAASVYQGILQSTEEERMRNRARLGLARIYEMQDQLGKAREQYAAVSGGFADLAKARAESLALPKTVEACTWLATAQPPRRAAPTGPGTPGRGPAFSAGDVPLPGETSPGAEGAADGGPSLDSLLQGLDLEDLTGEAAEKSDRYDASTTSPTTDQPSGDPPTSDLPSDVPPAADATQPPATPAADKPAD